MNRFASYTVLAGFDCACGPSRQGEVAGAVPLNRSAAPFCRRSSSALLGKAGAHLGFCSEPDDWAVVSESNNRRDAAPAVLVGHHLDDPKRLLLRVTVVQRNHRVRCAEVDAQHERLWHRRAAHCQWRLTGCTVQSLCWVCVVGGRGHLRGGYVLLRVDREAHRNAAEHEHHRGHHIRPALVSSLNFSSCPPPTPLLLQHVRRWANPRGTHRSTH